jgi:hypothetical protein
MRKFLRKKLTQLKLLLGSSLNYSITLSLDGTKMEMNKFKDRLSPNFMMSPNFSNR